MYQKLDSKAFYEDKGLKRTAITLRPTTVEFLSCKAKEFSKTIKSTTQGELVDVMAYLYANNANYAKLVDDGVKELLDNKEMRKAGRKVGWRKEISKDDL